jgi:hypothetical protein
MQLNYNLEPTNGVEGGIVDDTMSRNASFYADGDIIVGRAVAVSTLNGLGVEQYDSTQTAMGVAIHDITQTKDQTTGLTTISDKDSLTVRIRGRTWVYVPNAVSFGQSVYVTPTGTFSSMIAGNAPFSPLGVQAIFVTTTTGAGLTIIEAP